LAIFPLSGAIYDGEARHLASHLPSNRSFKGHAQTFLVCRLVGFASVSIVTLYVLCASLQWGGPSFANTLPTAGLTTGSLTLRNGRETDFNANSNPWKAMR
jgi:hypothetical protein